MASKAEQKVKARIARAFRKASRRGASLDKIVKAMDDFGVTIPVQQFTITHAKSTVDSAG